MNEPIDDENKLGENPLEENKLEENKLEENPFEKEYNRLELLPQMPVLYQPLEHMYKNRYSNVLPNRDTCVGLSNST